MASLAHYKYTDLTKRVMAQYLPMWDWRWGPAQLYQESNWTPWAQSSVGARGIAQFMPDTAGDVGDDLGYDPITDANDWRIDPEKAIPAYAYYMHNLRKVWTHVHRGEDDIRLLTQAAYNCGTGNLIKAQKLAGGSREVLAILAALPQVTGTANAHQTTDYVTKIAQWYVDLCTRV